METGKEKRRTLSRKKKIVRKKTIRSKRPKRMIRMMR
jgi:hypothetical protein